MPLGSGNLKNESHTFLEAAIKCFCYLMILTLFARRSSIGRRDSDDGKQI